jgi:hypothetical protein
MLGQMHHRTETSKFIADFQSLTAVFTGKINRELSSQVTVQSLELSAN